MATISREKNQARARRQRNRCRLGVEELEARQVLSLIFGSGGLLGADTHGSSSPIRLDIVALHEFGHSLGLDHNNDLSSIMYPYYNANYNFASLATDSATATLLGLYANVNTSPWKDSLDPTPGNGVVDVTYSFMPDGARMDKGNNTLFSTMRSHFGPNNAVWQGIFTLQLQRWEDVSNGKLNFVGHSDGGQKFNVFGQAQNDSRLGDIRIGSHRFDGAGKVLAHAYFPPPNGSTAAGDAHFDNSENWTNAASLTSSGSSGSTSTGSGDLTLGAAPTDPTDLAALLGAITPTPMAAERIQPAPEAAAATPAALPLPAPRPFTPAARMTITDGFSGGQSDQSEENEEDAEIMAEERPILQQLAAALNSQAAAVVEVGEVVPSPWVAVPDSLAMREATVPAAGSEQSATVPAPVAVFDPAITLAAVAFLFTVPEQKGRRRAEENDNGWC